jgi:hypothetical protein
VKHRKRQRREESDFEADMRSGPIEDQDRTRTHGIDELITKSIATRCETSLSTSKPAMIGCVYKPNGIDELVVFRNAEMGGDIAKCT